MLITGAANHSMISNMMEGIFYHVKHHTKYHQQCDNNTNMLNDDLSNDELKKKMDHILNDNFEPKHEKKDY
jgi:hypothetical protein